MPEEPSSEKNIEKKLREYAQERRAAGDNLSMHQVTRDILHREIQGVYVPKKSLASSFAWMPRWVAAGAFLIVGGVAVWLWTDNAQPNGEKSASIIAINQAPAMAENKNFEPKETLSVTNGRKVDAINGGQSSGGDSNGMFVAGGLAQVGTEMPNPMESQNEVAYDKLSEAEAKSGMSGSSAAQQYNQPGNPIGVVEKSESRAINGRSDVEGAFSTGSDSDQTSEPRTRSGSAPATASVPLPGSISSESNQDVSSIETTSIKPPRLAAVAKSVGEGSSARRNNTERGVIYTLNRDASNKVSQPSPFDVVTIQVEETNVIMTLADGRVFYAPISLPVKERQETDSISRPLVFQPAPEGLARRGLGDTRSKDKSRNLARPVIQGEIEWEGQKYHLQWDAKTEGK
ncbi:MAG: hypothetical protein SGI71_06110 [Verrucomicrobiota bacterium]|nr:hypothetical protein [Verrucomicrobiota bacterium]